MPKVISSAKTQSLDGIIESWKGRNGNLLGALGAGPAE